MRLCAGAFVRSWHATDDTLHRPTHERTNAQTHNNQGALRPGSSYRGMILDHVVVVGDNRLGLADMPVRAVDTDRLAHFEQGKAGREIGHLLP